MRLHFLPKYAPELNPIERVWWHMREEVTRNHSYKSIEELIEGVFGRLWDRQSFIVDDQPYELDSVA